MNTKITNRHGQILELLRKNGMVRTGELTKLFHTTSETIRKDLLYLEKLGVLEKGHGCARLSPSYMEAPILIRSQINIEEKKGIAELAVNMIPDGSVIFLDGGSTLIPLAEKLICKEHVTVITTSLNIAEIITSNTSNEAFIANGFVKKGALTVKGPYTVNCIQYFKTSLAFMGTNGMQNHNGATCKDYEDITIKKAVLENTNNAVLLCDSHKFSMGAAMEYAGWEAFSLIITDDQISDDDRKRVSEKTQLLITRIN